MPTKPQDYATTPSPISDYLKDLTDAAASDAALAELASDKDDTISLAEWSQDSVV